MPGRYPGGALFPYHQGGWEFAQHRMISSCSFRLSVLILHCCQWFQANGSHSLYGSVMGGCEGAWVWGVQPCDVLVFLKKQVKEETRASGYLSQFQPPSGHCQASSRSTLGRDLPAH